MLTSTETGRRRSRIFLQDQRIYGQLRGDPAGLSGLRGPGLLREQAAKFQSTRVKGSDTSARTVPRLLPAGPNARSWPACRSLGWEPQRLYSISERSVSRLSLLEPSSSVSPVWSKHRRQSPLFTRNAVSHCGHWSGSCVIAGSRSVKP
jgi:hypothetical protein